MSTGSADFVCTGRTLDRVRSVFALELYVTEELRLLTGAGEPLREDDLEAFGENIGVVVR